MVYKQIYASSSMARASGGAMFWQLMAEGMYRDGIILSCLRVLPQHLTPI